MVPFLILQIEYWVPTIHVVLHEDTDGLDASAVEIKLVICSLPCLNLCLRMLNDLILEWRDSCLFFALPSHCFTSLEWPSRVSVTLSIPEYAESPMAFFPVRKKKVRFYLYQSIVHAMNSPLGSIKYKAFLSRSFMGVFFVPPLYIVPSCMLPVGNGPLIHTKFGRRIDIANSYFRPLLWLLGSYNFAYKTVIRVVEK